MAHYTLDARRLMCPLPVIRTQDRVAELNPDDTLEIVCTDPGALHDIPAWCRINGHSIMETKQADNEISITVKVGKE